MGRSLRSPLRLRPIDAGSALQNKQRRMTQALALMLIAGPVPALVWLALPHRASADELAMVSLCVLAWAAGAALLAWPAKLAGDRALGLLLAGATVLISLGIHFTGDSESAFVLLFLWATPYSWFFFTARHAALQTVWFALCYGAVLMLDIDAGVAVSLHAGREEPALWLTAVSTVAVVGLLVRRLAGWLHSDETRFRRGFEESHLGMALVSTDLRYLEVNDALCDILGRGRAAIVGSRVDDHGHPDDIRPSYQAVLAGLEEDGGRSRFEKRYMRPDGTVVPARLNVTLIRSPTGQGLYYYTVVENISERRRAEAAAARRSRCHEALAAVSQAALVAGDLDGVVNAALGAVEYALDAPSSSVLHLVPGTEELVIVAARGRGDAATAAEQRSWGLQALRSTRAVVVDAPLPDAGGPVRFGSGACGVAVGIHGTVPSYGVLTVSSYRSEALGADDVPFLEAVAGVLGTVAARHAERHPEAPPAPHIETWRG
jgi:PAS domain S-box-containing protein